MVRKQHFDLVLLETTGLADPAPIASKFWLDDELDSLIYLDGIITVVDAKSISSYLSQKPVKGTINEAEKQIAMADRIVLNKIDLVTDKEISMVERRIKSINQIAEICIASRGEIDNSFIFDMHSFDGKGGNRWNYGLEDTSNHVIDDSVTTVAFSLLHINISKQRLDEWMQNLLWNRIIPAIKHQPQPFPEFLRIKGVLSLDNEYKYVVQSVQELFDIQKGSKYLHDEKRLCKMVFIGRNLDKLMLQNSFSSFVLNQ